MKYCLKSVRKAFHSERLLDITPQRIEQYQQDRLNQGMAKATVNPKLGVYHRHES